MKHLFQFLLLAFFAANTLVLSSCGDDKKTDPVPPATTGTLNGQITPANAITTVTATSTTTPAVTATATPNASGAYTFPTLAAGTYTLSFTSATGYGAPGNLTGLVVTAGGSTTAPPVTATQGGTVTGQITPANAITTVTATGPNGQVTTVTPSANGTYTFNLPSGVHTLTFTPAPGFTTPAGQRISVYANGTTTPNPTNVTQSGGTATLTVDGVATTVTLVRANYSFGDLLLTLISPNGGVGLQVSPYNQTVVVGTFAGASNARLYYTETTGNGSAQWNSPTTGNPTGTYTVTPNGTNPVRVSGTFNCALPASGGGAIGTRSVTGTFTNVAL